MLNPAIGLLLVIAAAAATVPSLVGAWDRAAAQSGKLEMASGTPRSLDRWRRRATDALRAEHYAAAAADARTLLARAPLDRTALRVLATAELAQGNDDAAMEVLVDASLASRRDAFTQLQLFELTSGANDLTDAAQRADTISRLDGFREEGFGALATLLALPGGATAVAARLATMPPWREEYFGELAQGVTPRRIMLLLAALRRTARPASPDEIERVLTSMVVARQGEQAWAIWRGRTGADQALIDDPDFRSVTIVPSDRVSPAFRWWMPGDSIVRILDRRDTQGRRALTVDAGADRSRMFVSRRLFATPGRYRFSYVAEGAASVVDRLRPDFTCGSGAAVSAEPVLVARPAAAANIVVPANCGLLRAGFTLEAGETASGAEIALRGVALSPAR